MTLFLHVNVVIFMLGQQMKITHFSIT